jgi:hypothetical protein
LRGSRIEVDITTFVVFEKANRRMSKDGIAALNLLIKKTERSESTKTNIPTLQRSNTPSHPNSNTLVNTDIAQRIGLLVSERKRERRKALPLEIGIK